MHESRFILLAAIRFGRRELKKPIKATKNIAAAIPCVGW
jgi:hypothetical protein